MKMATNIRMTWSTSGGSPYFPTGSTAIMLRQQYGLGMRRWLAVRMVCGQMLVCVREFTVVCEGAVT